LFGIFLSDLAFFYKWFGIFVHLDLATLITLLSAEVFGEKGVSSDWTGSKMWAKCSVVSPWNVDMSCGVVYEPTTQGRRQDVAAGGAKNYKGGPHV